MSLKGRNQLSVVNDNGSERKGAYCQSKIQWEQGEGISATGKNIPGKALLAYPENRYES